MHVTAWHTLCIWLQSGDGARLDGKPPRDDKDVRGRVCRNEKTAPLGNSESQAIRSRSERTTPIAQHFRKSVLASIRTPKVQVLKRTCPRALRKLAEISLILGTSLASCGDTIIGHVRVFEFVVFFLLIWKGGGMPRTLTA